MRAVPRDAKLRCPGSRARRRRGGASRAAAARSEKLLGEVPDVSGDEAAGRATRRISARARGRSAMKLMTSAEATTSNEASANGSLRASATWNCARFRAGPRGGADLRRRGVDAVDTCRSAKLDQRLRENARAAADIEPARAPCRAEPVEEHRRDRAAPAAHAPLVAALPSNLGAASATSSAFRPTFCTSAALSPISRSMRWRILRATWASDRPRVQRAFPGPWASAVHSRFRDEAAR